MTVTPDGAAREARAREALMARHAELQEVLDHWAGVLATAADRGGPVRPVRNLAALLGRMHGATGKAEPPAPVGQSQAADPQAEVLSLLLQAGAALARAGEADRACRLTASAWAALRETVRTWRSR